MPDEIPAPATMDASGSGAPGSGATALEDSAQPTSGGGPRPGTPARSGSRRGVVLGALATVLVAAATVAAVLLTAAPAPARIGLSDALAAITAGEVTAATLNDADDVVVLTLRDGSAAEASYPAAYAGELTQELVDSGAAVSVIDGRSSLGSDLAQRGLPLVLLLVVLYLVIRKVSPGMVRPRRHRALESGEIPAVTFADVAGVDEAVDQLREMVHFLREPARYTAVGATRPRGALLVGPPGTGKTLLARAVAGEAAVPFFALAGSDFVETYVGTGARRVRDLFVQARKAERAIIFIDEIDAVGRARSDGPTNGGEGERENTLVALLNEMDGFADSQVIVLAATNRPDTLDPALIRPGRLDRQVQVPSPDRRGRTLILGVHAAARPIADDVDLIQIARQTPGMSGADLAQVVNEACMEAARRDQVTVDAACFQAAVATVAMGRARTSALITDFDREVTAWHEAGHTLAALLLPDADDPVSVTIIPRGPAGGATWMGGNDDVFLLRARAHAQLVVAMAGRAAEERLLGGEHTQGASGDLQSATRLATAMVTQYGMTDFGYAQVDPDALRLGGAVAASAHAQVDRLLRDAHQGATSLLEAHAGALRALATALLVEETLPVVRIRQIVDSCRGAAA